MDKNELTGKYFIENGKIVFRQDILGEYTHEYKNLEEVCEELNGYIEKFNHYSALIDDYNYKIGELEKKLDLKCDMCIDRTRKESAAEILQDLINQISDKFGIGKGIKK